VKKKSETFAKAENPSAAPFVAEQRGSKKKVWTTSGGNEKALDSGREARQSINHGKDELAVTKRKRSADHVKCSTPQKEKPESQRDAPSSEGKKKGPRAKRPMTPQEYEGENWVGGGTKGGCQKTLGRDRNPGRKNILVYQTRKKKTSTGGDREQVSRPVQEKRRRKVTEHC